MLRGSRQAGGRTDCCGNGRRGEGEARHAEIPLESDLVRLIVRCKGRARFQWRKPITPTDMMTETENGLFIKIASFPTKVGNFYHGTLVKTSNFVLPSYRYNELVMVRQNLYQSA